MYPRTYFLSLAAILALGAVVTLIGAVWYERRYVTVERTEYHAPKPPEEEFLKDDRLEDKPSKFDPDLVDRRPLQGWLVNHSAAVIRLDCPEIKPDREGELLTLYPSYAAVRQVKLSRGVLPSVNMLDGKATQFDNGLYAALDQAYYRGLAGKLLGHVELVQRLAAKVGKDGAAAPFLAAGLSLADVKIEVTDKAAVQAYLAAFAANEVQSKPIGFYTWNDTLKKCFRFLRFFQHKFAVSDLGVPRDIARVLSDDESLRGDYHKALQFYARLTNPFSCLSVADLIGKNAADEQQLAKQFGARRTGRGVALFPPSTTRELVLFERLFPEGLPPNTNLMRELIKHIRSGKIDLKPNADSGWYDYQVYALETFLLPEKGDERDRLLLTKNYKKRMLEAFKSLITKRRETHLRQTDMNAAGEAPPSRPAIVQPRLRLEPCPTFYLRTARAYVFLANFLEASLGAETLRQLRGLTKDGERKANLFDELHDMRDLFYGLYLVSADDIGLKPAFLQDEPVDAAKCYQQADSWLPRAFDDPDLAADTRVSVPIFVDRQRGVTRLWATLGVRLAKLDASYARSPSIKLNPDHPAAKDKKPGRPIEEDDRDLMAAVEWRPAEAHTLATSYYLIPVDEFAEIELKGLKTLTREELRAVCDKEKTKPAILAALGQTSGAGDEPEARALFTLPWRWIASPALFACAGFCFFVGQRLKSSKARATSSQD
jgi:hypothetical protein